MVSESSVEKRVRAELRRLVPGADHASHAAAMAAYQQARMDGLCHEGAWECAVAHLRSLASSAGDGTESG